MILNDGVLQWQLLSVWPDMPPSSLWLDSCYSSDCKHWISWPLATHHQALGPHHQTLTIIFANIITCILSTNFTLITSISSFKINDQADLLFSNLDCEEKVGYPYPKCCVANGKVMGQMRWLAGWPSLASDDKPWSFVIQTSMIDHWDP